LLRHRLGAAAEHRDVLPQIAAVFGGQRRIVRQDQRGDLGVGKVLRLGDTLRHLFLLLDPEKQVGHVLQAIDQRECHRDVVAVIADHVVGRTEHVGEDEAPVAQVA